MKIAYNLEEISGYDEKITDDIEVDEEKYEFIPGYKYIIKEKLNNFIKLISEGTVHLKTANTVANMISYLKIMLNRDYDLVFLNIKQYLYYNLIGGKMINYIVNPIKSLDFEKFKELMEISPEINKEREEYKNKLNRLKNAKDRISILINNKNINNENNFE